MHLEEEEQSLLDVPETEDAGTEQPDTENVKPSQLTSSLPPLQTPTGWRSTRPPKHNPVYAHSLHCLLVTDGADLE